MSNDEKSHVTVRIGKTQNGGKSSKTTYGSSSSSTSLGPEGVVDGLGNLKLVKMAWGLSIKL